MNPAPLMLLTLAFTAVALAQNKPISIKGQCSPELVQNLSIACSTDEPCPLFLELASVEIVSSRLVLTGNLHTASQTVESLLLTSDDGGRNWAEAHPRIPG